MSPPRHGYWFFVAVGFFVVTMLYLIQKQHMKEGFDTPPDPNAQTSEETSAAGDQTTETAPTPVPSDTVSSNPSCLSTRSNSTYSPVAFSGSVKEPIHLPNGDHVVLYLSAFSNGRYSYETNLWHDSKADVSYFLASRSLPTSVSRYGLNIKEIMIRGPSALMLAPDASAHKLDSFTMVFYMNVRDIVFPGCSDIVELLHVPCQSPHWLDFFFSTNQAKTELYANVRLGSESDVFTWKLNDKMALTSEPRVITVTYNKTTNKLCFFYGKNKGEENNVSSTLNVTLGVSNLMINDNINMKGRGTLDANLMAFAYYKTALSDADVAALSVYFDQQANGLAEQYALARETGTELAQAQKTLQDLQKQLANKTCPSLPATPQVLPSVPPKWIIKMGAATDGVSTVELGKCSPLHVKSYGEVEETNGGKEQSKETEKSTQEQSASSAVKTSTSFPRTVPYPPNSVTSSTMAEAAGEARVTNPSQAAARPSSRNTVPQVQNVATNATSATTTTTSTSSTQQQDPDFWPQFFGFLQNQQNKNSNMTTPTSQTNLNTAYDALRKEVSTDKTQPGNLLFQPAVQDPPKQVTPPPVVQTKSWWDSITDVFLN